MNDSLSFIYDCSCPIELLTDWLLGYNEWWMSESKRHHVRTQLLHCISWLGRVCTRIVSHYDNKSLNFLLPIDYILNSLIFWLIGEFTNFFSTGTELFYLDCHIFAIPHSLPILAKMPSFWKGLSKQDDLQHVRISYLFLQTPLVHTSNKEWG